MSAARVILPPVDEYSPALPTATPPSDTDTNEYLPGIVNVAALALTAENSYGVDARAVGTEPVRVPVVVLIDNEGSVPPVRATATVSAGCRSER